MIILVDATTFAIILVARAMWYMSLLLFTLLAFLVWAIYAGGAKLAGPIGGIGAVLAVVLIPVVIGLGLVA